MAKRNGTAPGGTPPPLGAILVLTAWLPAPGSYAVLSYRRGAGTD